MAKLLDEYAAIAPWDVSTRQTNEGFIRRTIKPALGHLQVRKVRGPILDKLYAELRRCGDLSCTGRPFTEHRNIPALVISPRDPRPAWLEASGDDSDVAAFTVLEATASPPDAARADEICSRVLWAHFAQPRPRPSNDGIGPGRRAPVPAQASGIC